MPFIIIKESTIEGLNNSLNKWERENKSRIEILNISSFSDSSNFLYATTVHYTEARKSYPYDSDEWDKNCP